MADTENKTIQIRTNSTLFERWNTFVNRQKNDNNLSKVDEVLDLVMDQVDRIEKEQNFTSYDKQIKNFDSLSGSLRNLFIGLVEIANNTENTVREEFAKRLDNQDSQISELRNAANSAKEEAQNAKIEAKQAIEERQVAIQEKENLETVIASLSADKSQLSESLKNLTEQNASMISKVNEFEKLNSDFLALKDSFNRIQSELAVTNANLESSEKNLKEKDQVLVEFRNSSEKALSDLKKEFEKNLAEKTAEFNSRLKELKAEAKEQNSGLKALYEAQIKDLRKANDDLNLRLEQALSLNNSKSDSKK
jgi:chromosome segregation ATPase